MDTKIVALRRTRLVEWLKTHSVPQDEKSTFSQLRSGKMSFGEKLARRLEVDYGMGHMYLDTAAPTRANVATEPAQESPANPAAPDPTELVRLNAALLSRYWALDEDGRRAVEAYIVIVEQRKAAAQAAPTAPPPPSKHAAFEIDPPDAGEHGGLRNGEMN